MNNMKFEKDGTIIEIEDTNTHNIFIREGFKKVEEEVDEELIPLREKAKELGIKSAHTMKKETLIAKIEELQK
jgi:hypothetical protein